VTATARGEETPSESESSGDGGEEEEEDVEGEIISPHQSPPPTPPTHPPPPDSLLSLGDLFGQQLGIPARVCEVKRPRVDVGGASSLPSHPDLALVCSFWLVVCGCIIGAWLAHLFGAQQVPLPPLVAGVVASVTAGPSSSGGGGAEPPLKRAHPWSFLPLSSWYTHGTDLGFWYFGSPDFEGSVVLMIGTTPYWCWLPVNDRWQR
jgi:hypothetical protein